MSLRRRTLRVTTLAVALGAIVLSSCGSGGSEADAKELNVVLVNTPWARAITPHIPEFEKETGIKVKLQQFAQPQARDKIFVSLSSRSTDLDVFNVLPSNEGIKWQRAGLLEDLESRLAKADADYDAKGFTPAMLDASRLDKELVGIPVNAEGPVVYYRKDLLKKYDIAVPKTVDELVAAAAKIHGESKGKYVSATRGQSPTVAYTFGNFLHNEGAEWAKGGKPAFGDPRAVKAIDDYVKLAGTYGPKGAVNNGPVQTSALMASGRAAFQIDSSNELDSVIGEQSKVADQVGIMPIPEGTARSQPTLLAWNLGVSKFSKKKDQSWKFIQWATSPEMMLTLAEDGVAPPRDETWKDPAFEKLHSTPAKKDWVASVTDILATGTGEVGPPADDQGAARKVIGDEIDKVILGQQDAEAAAANIQKGLQPLLATKE